MTPGDCVLGRFCPAPTPKCHNRIPIKATAVNHKIDDKIVFLHLCLFIFLIVLRGIFCLKPLV